MILIICEIIQVICCFVMFSIAERQRNELRVIAEKLKSRERDLEYLIRRYNDMREQHERDDADAIIFQADYWTSESDLLKYSSDKKMYCAIKNRLAMLIGNDIVTRFGPTVIHLGEGKEKYSLIIKAKKI